MPTRELTIEEIQQETKRLLQYFDEVCSAHGLRYFVAYGTLLGAVRHAGPIPWDDDVDVVMPRPDYDRLLTLLRDVEERDTKLFSPGDPSYPVHFAKLVSRRTIMEEPSAYFPEDYGVFVDIFPLDGLPRKGAQAHLRITDWIHRLFQASYHHKLPPQRPLPRHEQLRRIIGRAGRVLPRSWYVRLIERRMRTFDYHNAERVAVLLSVRPLSAEVLHKDELRGERRLPYDDIVVRAFRDSEVVLERLYGPTWRTPIKREVETHGTAKWRENWIPDHGQGVEQDSRTR